jgi:5'-deoxynucleotidase
MEKSAGEKIANSLPEEMRPALSQYIMADEQSEEYAFVKAADKLAAYVKCLEELRSGNMEFSKAKKSIEKELRARKIPEVEYFFKHFIPSFELTLDELETL